MFEELKERFTMEPVLVIPDLNREMRVETDASDFVTGEVLSMKCRDEKWRSVVSRLLTVDFILFSFSFLFYFSFLFLLIFYF